MKCSVCGRELTEGTNEIHILNPVNCWVCSIRCEKIVLNNFIAEVNIDEVIE